MLLGLGDEWRFAQLEPPCVIGLPFRTSLAYLRREG